MPFSVGGMPERNQPSITALLLIEKHLCQFEQRKELSEEKKRVEKTYFLSVCVDCFLYFSLSLFKFLHEKI